MSANTPPTMRAAVLYGKEDVRVERIPVPVPGPGELLLKVEAALTCGTDLKVFRRGYHAAMIRPPSVFGHEMAGTVAACGETPAGDGTHPAPRFPVGTRVVVANSAPCGACYPCRRDQENLCEDLHFLNGAYAEYLRVPARFVERNTYRIADHASFETAALAEPLACVVQGLDETALRRGDTVAVLGLGPIGLMFVAMLKARGATVVGLGRHALRLDTARALGADTVLDVDAGGHWHAELRRRHPHLDVVIEATGKPEVWEQALALVRKGGIVNLFGGCPAGTKITLDTHRLHYDQVTVKSSFHHRPSAVRAALTALEQGVLPPRLFIGGEKPLEELPALLRGMLHSNRTVKTCIRP
ncbi:MAG: alcohol dehydrogenase catalytic domain-containing protein [Planctomycetota bacterium]|nr:alcohol dehydrogenase catalytic domain-containing protein [Planctomycetota bacterium]